MKNRILVFSAILVFCFFLVIRCTETPSIEKNKPIQPTSYTPFPSGYDYPIPRDTIDNWIRDHNIKKIDNHGWNLFAGLNKMTNSGERVWQTWYQVSDVMVKPTNKEKSVKKQPHRKLVIHKSRIASKVDTTSTTPVDPPYPYPSPPDTCVFIGNGQGNLFYFTSFSIIPSTYYNQAAKDWIENKGFNSKNVLDSLHADGLKDVPQAPKDAIIMKNIFWPVSSDPNEYAALPIWTGSEGMNRLDYNGMETWKNAVALTTNPNPPDSVTVEYLYYYINRKEYNYKYDNAKTVNIDKFYHVKLDKEYLSKFNGVDSCVVNNSFMQVFNREFREGDYLVTIAQHIMTKEIEHWCMQTAWWDNTLMNLISKDQEPNDIPPGEWQNYRMNTAYFMAIPNIPKGINHVCFNPYIELTIPEKNRINSNCQNCHIRAAYPNPGGPFLMVDWVGGKLEIPKDPTPYYHAMQEGFIPDNSSIFDSLMRTDFNWGIPDRAQ